jgi:alginate O-acetyltransferase complex protein AlgF
MMPSAAIPFPLRLVYGLGLCVLIAAAATSGARAAEGRLYPSGPPNGVAYLRFANLTAQPVKVASAAATLRLGIDEASRVGEYDPVTPGNELTGSVVAGGKTAPIKLTLAQNELLTVFVTTGADGAPVITPVGDTPTDFNAQKAALALYNVDKACGAATLEAGGGHTAVISGVAPGKVGRRLVNPVNVALSVACSGASGVAAKVGQMDAGERYSIVLYAGAGAGAGPRTLALHDRMALLRP